MAKEKLKIYEHGSVFRIGWYIPEDEDFGATLGEDLSCIEYYDDTDLDHVIITKYLMSKKDIEIDGFGYYWESRSAASKILKELKDYLVVAMASQKKELPEWALTALENGWKPPKGWKYI
jgi:regulator of RNase E activity RraB